MKHPFIPANSPSNVSVILHARSVWRDLKIPLLVLMNSSSDQDKYSETDDDKELFFTTPGQKEFDISEIVRDVVVLAIPISHRCSDDCPEGRKLQELITPEEAIDERWDNLKNIFKEKG